MNKQIGIVMLLLMTTFIGFGVVIPVLPAVVDAVHLAYCYPFIPQHRSLCPGVGTALGPGRPQARHHARYAWFQRQLPHFRTRRRQSRPYVHIPYPRRVILRGRDFLRCRLCGGYHYRGEPHQGNGNGRHVHRAWLYIWSGAWRHSERLLV